MQTQSNIRASWFLVLLALWGVAAPLQSATVTVSPSSVSSIYSGLVTVQVSGLTNGETVLVERFIDANGNGLDSSDLLVQSFKLTDGQVLSFGGIRNANVPGDNDLAANGQITSTLKFAEGGEFTRGAGTQIFRVSSPFGRFSPAQQTLTVTQPSYAQHITGTILNGATPIPYALIGVLIPVGSDNQFISGSVADAAGNFNVAVTNGTYQMIAFKPGYVGSFATSPSVTINGADTNVTVQLVAGPYTFSGTVTDTSTSTGVPGFQMFITSTNNEYTASFSDSTGAFTAQVQSGRWKIETSDLALAFGGYFHDQNKPRFDVSAGPLAGASVQVTKGSALIYGTVRDGANQPLPGVHLSANDGTHESGAFTDANGAFTMAATAGTWYVASDSPVGIPPGATLPSVQVNVTAGAAVQTNLVTIQASHLIGRAFDGNNNPLSGVDIYAAAGNSADVIVTTAGDGSFDLPVTAGTWYISLDSGAANSRGLVPSQISFTIGAGATIANIVYAAPLSTRTISGSVKTATNSPIASLNVYANATINNTNYNANTSTDNNGNYSLPVLAGSWNVGVDYQGLGQRGLGVVPNQSSSTASGNQVINFVIPGPSLGYITFRFSLGTIGEFGASRTPVVTYPLSLKNYRVILHVVGETNPPAADTIFFTGPPGSGATNLAGDITIGASPDGTNTVYFGNVVRRPFTLLGGVWAVTYRGVTNYISVLDPQQDNRLVLPLPTLSVTNDVLLSAQINYKDASGSGISTPDYVRTNRIDVIDQNGNGDTEVFNGASYSYPATNRFRWSTLGTVQTSFYDDVTNRYFATFTESWPILTRAPALPGQQFQFYLNAPPGVNYTVQYSTNLAISNWLTLVVTNNLLSPITVVDPAATNKNRFYRVVVGP